MPTAKVTCGSQHTSILTTHGVLLQLGADPSLPSSKSSTCRKLAVPEIKQASGNKAGFQIEGPEYHFVADLVGTNQHDIALTTEGLVLVWGSGQDGRLGLDRPGASTASPSTPTAPQPLGSNSKTPPSQALPTVIPSLDMHQVVSVATGSDHSIVVTSTHSVYTWGCGKQKAQGSPLGHGPKDTFSYALPKRVEFLQGQQATECFAGGASSFVLTKRRAVFSWGRGSYGQLGHGTASDEARPKVIDGLQGFSITTITASERHTVALDDDGAVYSWGSNTFGQLGHGKSDPEPVCSPKKVSALANTMITSIAVGHQHTMALSLTDESVYSWGGNVKGQLGHGHTKECATPTVVDALKGLTVHSIAAGHMHSTCLVLDGSDKVDMLMSLDSPRASGENLPLGLGMQLWGWGCNDSGQLGFADRRDQTRPVAVEMQFESAGVDDDSRSVASVGSGFLLGEEELTPWADSATKEEIRLLCLGSPILAEAYERNQNLEAVATRQREALEAAKMDLDIMREMHTKKAVDIKSSTGSINDLRKARRAAEDRARQLEREVSIKIAKARHMLAHRQRQLKDNQAIVKERTHDVTSVEMKKEKEQLMSQKNVLADAKSKATSHFAMTKEKTQEMAQNRFKMQTVDNPRKQIRDCMALIVQEEQKCRDAELERDHEFEDQEFYRQKLKSGAVEVKELHTKAKDFEDQRKSLEQELKNIEKMLHSKGIRNVRWQPLPPNGSLAVDGLSGSPVGSENRQKNAAAATIQARVRGANARKGLSAFSPADFVTHHDYAISVKTGSAAPPTDMYFSIEKVDPEGKQISGARPRRGFTAIGHWPTMAGQPYTSMKGSINLGTGELTLLEDGLHPSFKKLPKVASTASIPLSFPVSYKISPPRGQQQGAAIWGGKWTMESTKQSGELELRTLTAEERTDELAGLSDTQHRAIAAATIQSRIKGGHERNKLNKDGHNGKAVAVKRPVEMQQPASSSAASPSSGLKKSTPMNTRTVLTLPSPHVDFVMFSRVDKTGKVVTAPKRYWCKFLPAEDTLVFYPNPSEQREEFTEEKISQYDIKIEDHDKVVPPRGSTSSAAPQNQPLHGASIRISSPSIREKPTLVLHVDTGKQGEEFVKCLWDTKKGGTVQSPKTDAQDKMDAAAKIQGGFRGAQTRKGGILGNTSLKSKGTPFSTGQSRQMPPALRNGYQKREQAIRDKELQNAAAKMIQAQFRGRQHRVAYKNRSRGSDAIYGGGKRGLGSQPRKGGFSPPTGGPGGPGSPIRAHLDRPNHRTEASDSGHGFLKKKQFHYELKAPNAQMAKPIKAAPTSPKQEQKKDLWDQDASDVPTMNDPRYRFLKKGTGGVVDPGVEARQPKPATRYSEQPQKERTLTAVETEQHKELLLLGSLRTIFLRRKQMVQGLGVMLSMCYHGLVVTQVENRGFAASLLRKNDIIVAIEDVHVFEMTPEMAMSKLHARGVGGDADSCCKITVARGDSVLGLLEMGSIIIADKRHR